MQIVHTQKFVRMSPTKLRPIADVVRNLEPNKAVEVLPYVNKRGVLHLQKVIKTALANAKNRSLTGEFVIKEIQINEGPRLKRGRPVSRGRWHPYKRPMSHIRVVLESVEVKQINKTDTGNQNTEKPKSAKEKQLKTTNKKQNKS